MFKFIHAADIHLDSPLKGLQQYEGAPVDEIRGATRRALENLVDLARDEGVDFVLIAGDVYDGDWKDHQTGLFFVKQMSRLREANIPVVMISGNHDAANKMTRTLRLPENVEFLSHKRAQTATTKELRELGVAVHGRSFGKQAEMDNFACDYPPADRGMFNIGLLHTSLAGEDGHEPYAPCSLDDLKQKQYDYWALGHVHTRSTRCEDPYIVFSGNTQGRHIREPNAKGCYLVTVDGGGSIDREFRPLDVIRWETCGIVASDAQRPDEVLDLLRNKLLHLNQLHAGMPLAVRIVLTASTRAHRQLVGNSLHWINEIRAAAIDAGAGRVWVEKVKFRTSAARKVDEAALTDGPVGELVDFMAQLRNDQQQLLEFANELTDLRSKLPIELLGGDDSLALDDPAYLSEVLAEIEPLLMSRLAEGAPEPL